MMNTMFRFDHSFSKHESGQSGVYLKKMRIKARKSLSCSPKKNKHHRKIDGKEKNSRMKFAEL